MTGRSSTLVAPGSWTVDSGASTVGFRTRHFGVATVQGRFTRFAGGVSEWGAGGSVDVASLETGNAIRDGRLLSAEFFYAERFPRIAFEAAGPLGTELTGQLTIRDITRPLVVELASAEAGDGALELRATAAISRKAFGLDWSALREAGRLIVGDRVDLVLDLTLRAL